MTFLACGISGGCGSSRLKIRYRLFLQFFR